MHQRKRKMCLQLFCLNCLSWTGLAQHFSCLMNVQAIGSPPLRLDLRNGQALKRPFACVGIRASLGIFCHLRASASVVSVRPVGCSCNGPTGFRKRRRVPFLEILHRLPSVLKFCSFALLVGSSQIVQFSQPQIKLFGLSEGLLR